MAAREINLIHEKKIFSADEERFINVIKKGAPYILGGYSVLLILVISISWFINSQISSIETKIQTEREQIKSQVQDESRYLLLKQKAAALTTLYGATFPYPEFFNFLTGLTGENITVSRMDMNTTGQLSLVVSASNTEAIDVFIREIIKAAETRFRQVELQNINYTSANSFTLQLGLLTQTKP